MLNDYFETEEKFNRDFPKLVPRFGEEKSIRANELMGKLTAKLKELDRRKNKDRTGGTGLEQEITTLRKNIMSLLCKD